MRPANAQPAQGSTEFKGQIQHTLGQQRLVPSATERRVLANQGPVVLAEARLQQAKRLVLSRCCRWVQWQ